LNKRKEAKEAFSLGLRRNPDSIGLKEALKIYN